MLTDATPAVTPRSIWFSDGAMVVYLALATVLVHALTGGRYGFHRDELATLEDSCHLAWGYVAYPPVTPFFGRLSLELFGTSLVGFRFFAGLAQAVAVVLTGAMARELGGGRWAQLTAAVAAVPFCLAGGALMQYVSFDCLCWVLTAWCVVRLLKSGDPRWWLAIGCAIEFGILTKYTIGFFVIGIAVGVVLTDARRYLRSKWLWYGGAVALLICSPNVTWQAQHNFVSLEFLRHIHARDVRIGRTDDFLPDQLKLTFLALPLVLAGLYYYFFSPAGRRFRTLGWMYVVPLLLFVIAKGRGYYLAAAYPMLYAAGSVWWEEWIRSLSRRRALVVRVIAAVALASGVVMVAALLLPIAPVNSAWWDVSSKIQGDFREEIGWPELVATVSRVRDSLPAADRARLGILAGNYGEAGAINLFGGEYGLPGVISGINSFWQRGYPEPPPETLIVLGFDRGFLEHRFSACEVAARVWNRYGVANEETTDHPVIFVCRGLRQSWPELWRSIRSFG